MAMNIENTTISLDEKRRIREDAEKIINELTSGIHAEKIKLDVYRGSQRFAVIFNQDGLPCYEVDPDDGEKRMVKIMVDGTWQLADGVASKMKTVDGAKKVMFWRWDEALKRYVEDRSKYDDKTHQHIGNEGAVDQYVRRHCGQKKIVATYPGAAELQYLAKAATEISSSIKKEKGKLPADAKQRIVTNFVAFLAGTGTTVPEAKKLLHAAWPEIFGQK